MIQALVSEALEGRQFEGRTDIVRSIRLWSMAKRYEHLPFQGFRDFPSKLFRLFEIADGVVALRDEQQHSRDKMERAAKR